MIKRDLAYEWRKLQYGNCDQSSLKRDKEIDSGYEKWTSAGLAKRCYCISCHKAGGYYLKDTSSIVYVCDDCYPKYGGCPIGTVPVEQLDELVADFDPNKITNLVNK